jgi:hypothetical protein
MGPQHWRGDRQGNESAAFTAFNVAFPGLVGRATELSAGEMALFTDFALQIRYPPNPIRKLDNSLRMQEFLGLGLFLGRVTDTVANCETCHDLDPATGHFGGDGQTSFEGETQHFKVPQLRNQYQKVGMFGMALPEVAGIAPALGSGAFEGDPSPFGFKGDQIRGFGFNHDGSIDTTFRFTGANLFSVSDAEQTTLQALMMAFTTDLAPIVGQQLTLNFDNKNNSIVTDRIDLMETAAGTEFVSEILGGVTTQCDVIAHIVQGGSQKGGLYDPDSDSYTPDDGTAAVSSADLRTLAGAENAGQEVTYTCVPPGSGNRMALDRDEDLLRNGHETNTGVFVSATDTGSNPALKDTDGDGFADGDEVLNLGSDPNDPNDPISNHVPSLGAAGLAALTTLLAAAGGRAAGRRRRRETAPARP